MSFKRLAIRTKKSLSGLYPSSINPVSSTSEQPPRTPPKDISARPCEESGVQPAGEARAARDSPSRRKRFLGSLRNMGSLPSLRASHSSIKASSDCPDKPEPDSPHTPVSEMPALALNFEASPADKPMFMMRKTSSSSSMAVHRSSPVSVPTSAKQLPPMFNTPPGLSNFTVGTMPESPAPLQKAVALEAAFPHRTDAMDDPESPRSVGRLMDPLPTPMPGTHLPLEDNALPEMVVSSRSSASMNPGMTQTDTEGDYFSAVVPNEGEPEKETSLVTTEALDPTTDANIVVMLAMGTHGDCAHSFETYLEDLPPLPSVGTMPRDMDEARRISSRRESLSDDAYIGGNLAYVVWDDPAIVDQDNQLRDRGSRYGEDVQHEVSNLSTSDHTGTGTENTGLTVPDEDRPDTKVVDSATQLLETPEEPNVTVSAEDRETLQDIIRAYAGSMAYHEEAEAHRAAEHSSDFSGAQTTPLEDVTSANAKAEVEYSIKVMNRSLGE